MCFVRWSAIDFYNAIKLQNMHIYINIEITVKNNNYILKLTIDVMIKIYLYNIF